MGGLVQVNAGGIMLVKITHNDIVVAILIHIPQITFIEPTLSLFRQNTGDSLTV